MFNPDLLPEDVIAAARDHAAAQYPDESVGVVTPEGYIPLPNIHPTPDVAFEVDRRLMADHPKIIALIHSHPDGPAAPSMADMRGQANWRIPWGIVVSRKGGAEAPFFYGDQVKMHDLRHRPFRHGVTDCYSLIRDWYQINRDVILPDFPRDWEWWADADGDLYQAHFAEAGFVEIPADQARVGDVFLAGVLSRRINHGGLLVSGAGKIFHHLASAAPFDFARRPVEEPICRWGDRIQKWLRYVG